MSTTDPKLTIKLYENRICTHTPVLPKPDDLEEIVQFLNRSRNSPSPSEKDYTDFCDTIHFSSNEETTKPTWENHLAYKAGSRGPRTYLPHYNINWNGVDNHITHGIADAKPDYAEYFQIIEYPPEAVSTLGLFANTAASMSIPSMCVQFKGPDGSMNIAQNQCAYDGALMVNNAHTIHKYTRSQRDFFSKTQALNVAYNGREVQYYSNHTNLQKQGEHMRQYYYQTLVAMDSPASSFENYKLARKRARNCQDWALAKATSLKQDLHDSTTPPPDWNKAAQEWNASRLNGFQATLRCNPTPSTSTSTTGVPGPAQYFDPNSKMYYYLKPDGTIEWTNPPPPRPVPALFAEMDTNPKRRRH